METGIPQKTSAYMNKITTIKISGSTKERIERLRLYPRETYEEVMQRILEILNISRISPERAQMKLIAFDKQKRRNFSALTEKK